MIHALIVLAALLLFGLSVLAWDSYRRMIRAARGVDRDKDPALKEFALEEAFRAAHRAVGWSLFCAALVVRVTAADTEARSYAVLAFVFLGCLVFLREAIRGRREREMMLESQPTADHDLFGGKDA